MFVFSLSKAKDRQPFKQVKHFIQTKLRSAYDNYLQELLGLAAQNTDESPSGCYPKKLFSLINPRQDSQGISTTMAIRTTVVPIRILIRTTFVPIRILIRTTAIISALS